MDTLEQLRQRLRAGLESASPADIRGSTPQSARTCGRCGSTNVGIKSAKLKQLCCYACNGFWSVPSAELLHSVDCPFIRALRQPMECDDHGRDVCPTCDRCTCNQDFDAMGGPKPACKECLVETATSKDGFCSDDCAASYEMGLAGP